MSGPPAWPGGPPTGPAPGWGQGPPAPPPSGPYGAGMPPTWGPGSWSSTLHGPWDAPPGPPGSRDRRRWPWVVVALVAVVAIAFPAAVLVVRADPSDDVDVDPAVALGSALAFLDGVETVRFEGEGSLRIDADLADEYPPIHWVVAARSEFPDRGIVRLEDEYGVTELLVVGDRHYTRSAEDNTVDDRPWSDLDELGYADEFLPPTFASPHALRDLLLTAHDPVLVPGHDGSADTVVLAVALTPGDGSVFTPARSYDPPTAELVVDPNDGRITAFTIRAGSPITQVGRASSELEVVSVDWDAAVALEAPDADELDPLPLLDDEAVRAYDDAVLYQPAELPEGWEQDYVEVASAADTVEGCDEVLIDYEQYETGDWLEIWQFPIDCAAPRPADADTIVAGEWEGWFTEDGDGVVQAELDVDGTNVQVITSLDAETVALVLEHLEPLDLEHPPPDTLELRKPD
jgi:hypothetical protein